MDLGRQRWVRTKGVLPGQNARAALVQSVGQRAAGLSLRERTRQECPLRERSRVGNGDWPENCGNQAITAPCLSVDSEGSASADAMIHWCTFHKNKDIAICLGNQLQKPLPRRSRVKTVKI
jgi:hypothetical protein